MTTINQMFDRIEDLEKQLRKKFPKQKGRVMIANIKSALDFTVGRENEVKWATEYMNKLKEAVK